MQGTGGVRTAISIWNVYLPAEVDRGLYIKNCFRTGTVTLINSNNEVIHKVPIGKLALQLINFPEDEESLGSVVSCGNVWGHNQLFVLDVYDYGNEFNNIEENQFRVIKQNGENKAEISLRGKNGISTVSVHSNQAKGGQLHINVTHADGESGLVKMSVTGKIEAEATGDISVQSASKIYAEVYDGNEDDLKTSVTMDMDNVSISSAGIVTLLSEDGVINMGEGTEPIVLGDTLAQLLKDFIQEVSIAQTASGPLLNAATLAAYIQQVDNILSEYSNTQ